MRWVIKLGGSLYNSKYLIQWLKVISDYINNESNKHNIIIVPGGGPFADIIRDADKKFKLDPIHAHNMAVLGMQQYGYLMASLCSNFSLAGNEKDILHNWQTGKAVIWEPYQMVSSSCELEKSWQVTSDSLATWLAKYLSADQLVFIKSSELALSTVSIEQLVKHKCIDIGIQKLLDEYRGIAQIMHKTQVNQFIEQLRKS